MADKIKRILRYCSSDLIFGVPMTIGYKNFRLIFDCIPKEEVVNQLILVTRELNGYLISNFSVKQFLDLYLKKQSIKVKSTYISSFLFCDKCGGSGKTDWIKKVVTVERVSFDHFSKMINSFKVKSNKLYQFSNSENILTIFNNQTKTLYSPIRKINQTEELCNYCYGTGLELFFKFGIANPTEINLKELE